MNGVDVKVIRAALGDGRRAWIQWGSRYVQSRTFPLHELIRQAGGCDVLKCDCEGAEWIIEPADIAGVRRIEMELHQPPIGQLPNPRLLEYSAGILSSSSIATRATARLARWVSSMRGRPEQILRKFSPVTTGVLASLTGAFHECIQNQALGQR